MKTKAQAGYSLVELLVVLALVGLIAMAISGGIRFGVRVWERTETLVEGDELARGGQTMLRALFSHLYPRQRTSDDRADEDAFSGERSRVAFVAVMPPSFNVNGLARVVLTAEGDANAMALVVVYQGERGPSNTQKLKLFAGAKEIAFAFAEPSDGAVVWKDTWLEKTTMPALIRVRVTFSADARATWPDLIVRPLLDRDASCIFDPVSFDCRNG